MTMEAEPIVTRAYGPTPQYPVESVDNALQIVMLLATRNELRLTDVSAHFGLASSTAHRLLAMLSYRGLIRQDPKTKAYRAGPGLDLLAFSVLRRLDVGDRARPVLEKLNATLRETVHLGRLEGAEVDFVASIESPQALRVSNRLGVAMPAHCTSTGKALLSALGPEELDRLYPQPDLVQMTRNSIASRAALHAALAEVRRRGYAISNEEGEVGVISIAVPLRSGAYALNASVPVSRMTRSLRRTVLSELNAAADEIEAMLP
ncbi:IclR family transcriptional regulator [Mycolicibacterium monacense]|uniref:IclR family transcriptional regulator n=2 Tax=Mycobacteriaceae TaxID=1762 RepID=A0AAD1IYQ0_MYCMB|nr:IclR family transcriptional regulator [Mycolicibacterium monacense]MDA4104845.1 IclR family transcriptional regulator [Mycolicibacterium monacense DSM 44395]ORB22853.1 IclR family transcriptional regulator [Mycolicibacterium monacense DSM 44395]QHP87733.1 IclR family transcriptional regulator [Mycolicibacterium monacense DSM 44395]BBZ59082.1 IclR family transcriptional regulator [Mycolicibacterium monacense]